MTGLLFSLLSVLVGMASLVGVLLALYWLTGRLPARMRESARVWVFVGPAMFFLVIGLVAPALRTIYFSMLDDTGKTTRVTGTGTTITNAGTISGLDTVFLTGDNATVHNTGLLTGTSETLYITGDGARIVNAGDIFGDMPIVVLGDEANLSNSGAISGRSAATACRTTGVIGGLVMRAAGAKPR